jgi:Zn-dependent hydrolases, including glyoxylases
MNKIGVYVLTLGPVQTNVYIAYNKESLECFIVDPSAQAGDIIATIKEHKLKPVAILLTHGHFDHIMAVNELVKEYNIKVYISKFDDEMLYDSRKSGGSSFIGSGYVTKADVLLNDGDVLHLLDKDIVFIATPGHTKGSGCYYIADEKLLFSGDTIFREDCGRTDLYGGDNPSIIRSIYEKVLTLPDDVNILPGHMDMTTVAHEKKYNPVAIYVKKHGIDR